MNKYVDIASENLRQNFIFFLSEWAKSPPFHGIENGQPLVICARFDDVMELYLNPDRFSVEPPPVSGAPRIDKFMGVEILGQIEGARHAYIRRHLTRAFSPAALNKLRYGIDSLASKLLDRIERNGPLFDAMADFSFQLMPDILLRQLCGMGPEQIDAILDMSAAIPGASRLGAGEAHSEDFKLAFVASQHAIEGLIAQRRNVPGEDLISQLIAMPDDSLSDKELHDQIFSLTAAALQTTASSMGAILYVLAKHPDQFDLVRREPSLVPAAIDECLRYHMPGFLTFNRYAVYDTTIGGVSVARGTRLRASPQAAGLDPTRYPDPLRVDVLRSPRNVPLFGAGIHHCLGHRLARMVLRIATEKMVSRFPTLRLQDPYFVPTYQGQVTETQISQLPMTFGASA